MPSLEEMFPPYGLRLRCGDLQLRCVREADVPQVAQLVASGIYHPPSLPFLSRWAEAPAEELAINTARFYWSGYAAFTPEEWRLTLLVHDAGTLVGVQDLSTRGYLQTRTIETGSWLAREHQGRGIGTRMRQVACTFAFDHLDAELMTSGFLDGNPASAAVSRKVGYRANGAFRKPHPDGTGYQTEERVVLAPDDLVRAADPVEVSGVAAFRHFIGLD